MLMIVPVTAGRLLLEHGGWTGEIPFAGESRAGDIDNEVATVARHVAEARRVVARQRARMAKLKALGKATLDQELTLRAFVSALAILESLKSHAQELADAARRLERPQRKLS
jgi:hypothetical protein